MFALILTLHPSLSTSTFFGRSQAIPHRSANQNTIHMYISFECVWVQAFNAYFMLSILWKSEGKKMQVKRITFHNSQEEWEGKHWDSKESDIQSVSAGERKRKRERAGARAQIFTRSLMLVHFKCEYESRDWQKKCISHTCQGKM